MEAWSMYALLSIFALFGLTVIVESAQALLDRVTITRRAKRAGR
jgi:hypothetical protein